MHFASYAIYERCIWDSKKSHHITVFQTQSNARDTASRGIISIVSTFSTTYDRHPFTCP
jgi:hypothetical protein